MATGQTGNASLPTHSLHMARIIYLLEALFRGVSSYEPPERESKPMTVTNEQLATALEKANWANVSIGNKQMLLLAIQRLREAKPK
jgi:hypothetical protein